MPSIFTKIIKGEIPSYKIVENDRFLVFLDAFPLKEGHTLVIPKQEVDYLFDLDDTTYRELMELSKKVALAIKKTVRCKRVSMQVIGLEVPHAHVHLIPINSMADCDFSRNKLRFTKEEFEATAKAIAANLS
jgi:histidine triad (HIT) family protein